jgi:hypothetical protein
MSDPAPDSYGTGVSDAQKAVTLVDTVVNLFAQSVRSIWQKRSKISSLKRKLGE